MEPLISIQLLRPGRIYQPREMLSCEYQIDAIDAGEITAVETSVLWYTEGKGDEDLSVHYFERRTPTDVIDGDLRPLRHIECPLPSSPLSYHGFLFKIRWCVRVRVFLRGGRDVYTDEIFQLGNVPAVPPPPEVEEEKKEVETGAH
jgi:hypothetical protein